MNTENQIAELDAQISDAKPHMELAKALDNLRNNPDFKKVILDGYFKQEAIRLVMLKADPSMTSPVNQASIIRDIDSIGALEQYFKVIDLFGRRAASSIEDAEAAREEVLAEADEQHQQGGN